MATVEERLSGLEQQVTRYRRVTVMLAVVLVAGVVMGQSPNVSNATSEQGQVGLVVFKNVICERLFVNGGMGKGSVEIGAGQDGGSITTKSPQGRE